MAEFSTILVLGDLTAAGQRPVGELTAINPSYGDVQPGTLIWNPTAGQWQDLLPGTNTNPQAIGTTFWGLETRLVAELDARIAPIPRRYIIKHAKASIAAQGRTTPSWTLADTPGELNALISTIITAAAASAPNTIRIDGIILSLQTHDFRLGARAIYGRLLQALIDTLRGPSGLPITLGSIRGDGGRTPVVVVEPHYGYTGLSTTERMWLVGCRMQAQALQRDDDRIAVVRSEQLTSTDGLTYSAVSMVELSKRCAAALLAPTVPDDANNPEAKIALLIGDSILDGTSPNAALPAHQQLPLTGTKIWSPHLGTFSTLEAGNNNQNSFPTTENGVNPGGSFQLHGPEIAIADSMRSVPGEVFIVKATAANSFSSPNTQALAIELAPTFDRLLHTWTPGARDQLWDLTIRGWLRSAIAWLRRTSRKPVLEMVVISVGTNDLIFRGTTPESCDVAVQDIVAGVKRIAEFENIDVSKTKFMVCVPGQLLANTNTVVGSELDNLRNEMLSLPNAALPGVGIIDLSDLTTADNIHPDAAGTAELARRILEIYRGGSQAVVSPLFVPTMADLRRSLRLSQIASTSDAIALIDTAVQHASVTFYRHLGGSKIEQLRGISYTRAPVTASEYLRVLAAGTEIKIVRQQLLRSMPTMFMDGSIPGPTWQQEAGFRENSTLMQRDELRRLDEEIRLALAELHAASLTSGGDLTTSVVSPDSYSSPGQSISATSF